MATPTTDVEETPKRGLLIAGVALLAIAGGLYWYSRKVPCGCGEKGVDDIVKASAEMQAAKEETDG